MIDKDIPRGALVVRDLNGRVLGIIE